jgi:hypothetical protein
MIMKFSSLERVRKNPQAFYDTGFIANGRSKLVRWQDALARFHKGKTMDEAETYLISSFAHYKDNPLNRRDLIKFTRYLHEYEEDYGKLDSEKVEFRKNLVLALSADNQISGQIPRVDINTKSDGYSIYYFAKKNFEWESELRFPVLQQGVADYFSCDAKYVKVGLYILEDGKHYSTTYDNTELKSAQDELQNLIEEVKKLKK